jgi:hypothetical protein
MALKNELREAFAEAGVTDAQFAKLEEIFTDEELQTKLAGGYLKNKDYTTKTAALADERRDFQKQQTDWQQGRDYMDRQTAVWKEDNDKRLNAALEDASQSRLYGAALESKLQALATEYGENFEDLLKDVKARRTDAPPPKTAEPDYKPYDERYVGRDEIKKGFDTMFAYSPMMRDFEWEYKKLYGKDYDGSIVELMKGASQEVSARQQRGQQSDLWTVMREKLDFDGQKTRNAESKVAADKQERADWEKKTREEIDRELRTQYGAQNPAAARSADKSNEWRHNLSANKRQEQQRTERKSTPMDDFKRRQDIHRAYEERAAKHEAA